MKTADTTSTTQRLSSMSNSLTCFITTLPSWKIRSSTLEERYVDKPEEITISFACRSLFNRGDIPESGSSGGRIVSSLLASKEKLNLKSAIL
ncbi:hypothetical protein P5673_012206 [Acropora cervicornis]|uniref:Uncharacterized protein n=1 Tax=Acropora cervicornis TaxID=6130 RepID=A0AAD9QME0_ACRCE|nr:hypothetical protein P5673_012206 [Acropora cervicornis]